MHEKTTDREARIIALHRLGVLAEQVPVLPLPDALNMTVSTVEELDEIALALTAEGTAFERRRGGSVRELIVPLGGLTYRVRYYGPRSQAGQATVAGRTVSA